MAKVMFLVLGLVVLAGTAFIVRAAPEREVSASQATMDIRTLERKMDMNALPKRDLDPAIYQ
jgi:hypothetical protein